MGTRGSGALPSAPFPADNNEPPPTIPFPQEALIGLVLMDYFHHFLRTIPGVLIRGLKVIFLAVQDSSISDIVGRSLGLSQLTIRAEQSRAEQSRAEQSRAEQSRAEQQFF